MPNNPYQKPLPARLNRDRPFGKVTPPSVEPGTDRAAFYAQDDKYFDVYDREIVPGVPAPAPSVPIVAAPAPAPVAVATETEAPATAPAAPVVTPVLTKPKEKSIAEVLAGLESGALPWAAFRKEAKRILGAACPAAKDATIAALRAAQGNGGKPVEEPQQAPAPVKTKSGTTIDLAGWGRNTEQYLFGDVRKAIQAKDAKVVSTVKDAIEHLIDTKVVTAQEAAGRLAQSEAPQLGS